MRPVLCAALERRCATDPAGLVCLSTAPYCPLMQHNKKQQKKLDAEHPRYSALQTRIGFYEVAINRSGIHCRAESPDR